MNPPDPAWLDRMYNNRTLVPDHADYFKRWAEESAIARQSHPCQLNVAFGDGTTDVADIFTASPAGLVPVNGAPVLVFIHGGYWRSLDKFDHSFLAPVFARSGTCVVVPNYALCPMVTIPQITQQMVDALAWTWRNISRYGGDPARITVIGHSAGGHLATMLLACNWNAHAADLPTRLVKNAMSISGLYDLEPLRHTTFLNELNLTPDHVCQASPALLPRPPQGCLYALAGANESDEFLRQNLLIRQAWGIQTVPVCESLAGLNHFSVLEKLADPAHRLHQLAIQLFGLETKLGS